ncbi:MAG: DUF1499 domain-containing protein [Erythrobacter sp.]
MADGKWTGKLGKTSRVLAIAALVVAGIGLTLARYNIVDKLDGFYGMLMGALAAVLACVLALISLLMSLRGKGASRAPAAMALILAVPFVAFIATRPAAADGAPAIHDITTNLAAPAEFQSLTVREDNLAGVDTVENWQAIHEGAYADIQPLLLNRPVSVVTEQAHSLAQDRGWEIAAFDAEAGRIEATDYVSYIRFEDIVVIEVTPSPDNSGSVVNMRSISQIGVSDLGVNAKRIRAFLSDLEAL